jgi:twitching motility protein PilT
MAYPYSLDDLLRMTVERDASDLHLKVGRPPVIRIYGDLVETNLPPLGPEDAQDLIYSILSPEQRKRFESQWELDLAYHIPGLARFRVNVYRQMGHIAAAMRMIPFHIKTIDELLLPQVLKQIAMRPRGLVLVTGPTGSGKSTTLAAMLQHINLNKRAHIITIEEPIEFLFQDRLSIFEQREVGQDTKSYAAALRHILRQNPDIILVGEMRDLETISLAIRAAETGHLVLSTLHTIDTPQTVDRVIDVFPPEQQEQIRTQLSMTLVAVISQSLLPRADKPGRIAAVEVLIAIPSIRALIREGKTHQIYSLLQTGTEYGMFSMDMHLLELYKAGLVTYEAALAKAQNPAEFEQRAKSVRPVRA